MNFENAAGAPVVCAFIVLLAIAVLGGISFAFQGSIQF